jgi:hypothetical protein
MGACYCFICAIAATMAVAPAGRVHVLVSCEWAVAATMVVAYPKLNCYGSLKKFQCNKRA